MKAIPIATSRLKKPIRFYDIADLPERIVRISENLAEEEARD